MTDVPVLPFDDRAAHRFAAGARPIVSADSVSHPTGAAPLAPLLAGAGADMSPR